VDRQFRFYCAVVVHKEQLVLIGGENVDRQFRFYCAVVVHKEQLSPVSRYYGLNLVSCKDQLLFKEENRNVRS